MSAGNMLLVMFRVRIGTDVAPAMVLLVATSRLFRMAAAPYAQVGELAHEVLFVALLAIMFDL